VTAADVAAKTGMPLHETIRELNKVAADTQAVLQVSNTGALAYAFKGDPDVVYQAKGIRKVMLDALAKVRDIVFFIVRCSFGLLLCGSIATLLVIFLVTIAFAMFAADAADGELGDLMGDGDFDGDLAFTFFDIVNLAMFFSWWHRDVGGDVEYYGRTISSGERGFISDCFAFLFGDRDPNRKFEEEAWTIVADLIRLNNGVITAAQVGPYLEKCGTDEGIFPVLVRFDGIPEVTSTGNIVYRFPSMQATAAGHVFNRIPVFGEQKQWTFASIPGRRMDFVFYFAGANLAGWICIATNLYRFDFLMKYKGIVEMLLDYAMFFVALPIARSILNAVRNAVIELNNKRREENAKLLGTPKMQARIAEAQAYATEMAWHDPSQLAYTTAESLMDQELDVLPPLPATPPRLVP
jgi:hypothetical protein